MTVAAGRSCEAAIQNDIWAKGSPACRSRAAKPSSCQVARPTVRRVNQPSMRPARSEEHTSELQSLMRISYAVFCLQKKIKSSEHPLPSSDQKYLNYRLGQLTTHV